jgi:hypothetical protein
MALRLRYQIDSPGSMREHLHFVEGAGYFFFPGVAAPKGTLATLEVDFESTGQVTLLRGWVWARSTGAGIWLELFDARHALTRVEGAPQRAEIRLGSEQLVLVEAEGLPALLCRLRDVSDGGARLAALPADAGVPGQHVRIALPEAGEGGAQLEARGRVIWVREGEVGIAWSHGDLTSRAAVRRLMEHAREDWDLARSAVHPSTCRCNGMRAGVVLLG